MATTKAPLFGLDASGTLGGAIVFSKWRGRTYVRKHAVPSNPRSGLQVGMRSILKFITQAWGDLATAVKDDWTDLAATDNITLLNAAVRDAQTRARMNLGTRRSPDDDAASLPGAATIDSVTAQPRSLVIAWTAGSPDAEFGWRLHRSTDTGFTPDISNLIAAVAADMDEYTDTGLTTAETYYYVLVGFNYNGDLGAASDELSGTPT